MTDKQNDAVHYFKQKFLAEWKTINPSKVIKTAYCDITMLDQFRFHFGGFPGSDEKIFIGVGFETWQGEDLCISYTNWHLIDAQGKEVQFLDMTEEERIFAKLKQMCGPGCAAPINL